MVRIPSKSAHSPHPHSSSSRSLSLFFQLTRASTTQSATSTTSHGPRCVRFHLKSALLNCIRNNYQPLGFSALARHQSSSASGCSGSKCAIYVYSLIPSPAHTVNHSKTVSHAFFSSTLIRTTRQSLQINGYPLALL